MISYCDDCGEYLGDYVNGVLYKFGEVVSEPHLCPGIDINQEEVRKQEGIRRLANLGYGSSDALKRSKR